MKHQHYSRRRVQAGFSLIELLIVVAIVGILAAVAVPKLLKNLETGRETAAIQTLRTVHNNQAQFSAMKGKFGTLAELNQAALIDANFASGQAVSGYVYTSTEATPDQYCVQSTRSSATTASRDFNVIEDGTIRYIEAKTPSPVPHSGGSPLAGAGAGGATGQEAPKTTP